MDGIGIAFIYMHVPDPLFIILFQFLYAGKC